MRTVILAALAFLASLAIAAEPEEPVAAFAAWLQAHAATIRMGDLSATEAATGAHLAQARTAPFVAALVQDPEQGLGLRVPADLLAALPATVAIHVERPWSGSLRLEVLCGGLPLPGGGGGGIERWAVVDGERLRALPTGPWREALTGRFEAASGLRIGDVLVLLGSPTARVP